MDKYQNAIMEYEKYRIAIIDIGRKIGLAANYTDDDGLFSSRKCASSNTSKTCIEDYWQSNKDARYAHECTGETVEPEVVELCPSCKEVDRLVILRKDMRKRFGVAKRRLSQLGKSLL